MHRQTARSTRCPDLSRSPNPRRRASTWGFDAPSTERAFLSRRQGTTATPCPRAKHD